MPSSTKNPADTHEVAAAARRMIKATGKRVATEDPCDLELLRDLDAALKDAWAVAVDGLRDKGATDVQIGEALGTSRQAVAQRWPWKFKVSGQARTWRESR